MAALAAAEAVSRRLQDPPVAAPLGVEFHLAYGSELHLLTSLASMAVSPFRIISTHDEAFDADLAIVRGLLFLASSRSISLAT